MKRLYQSKGKYEDSLSAKAQADFEEVAASCGYFSFNLQDFAKEMQTFLRILTELKEEAELPNNLSWNWLRFWQNQLPQKNAGHSSAPERERLLNTDDEDDNQDDNLDLRLGRKSKIRLRTPELDGESFKWASLHRWMLKVLKFVQKDDSKECGSSGLCMLLIFS